MNEKIISKISALPKVKLLFMLFLIVLSIFRIRLTSDNVFQMNTIMMHDSALQLHQAVEISDGSWLGEYDHRTLSKGVMYPLFLAVGHGLDISYPVFLVLYFILCSAITAAAFYPLYGRKAYYKAGFVYLAVLYCPIGFSSVITYDIYRNAISGWTSLVVMSCGAAVFLRRTEGFGKLFFWSLLESLALGFFWYQREDSIWIVPFVAAALIITGLFWLLQVKRLSVVLYLILLIIPVTGVLGAGQWIKIQNEKYYGLGVINDRSGTAFAEFMETLYSIDDGRKLSYREQEWIATETYEKLFDISPTLAEDRYYYDFYWEIWSQGKGMIVGDIYQWFYRQSAEQTGRYNSANEADQYWSAVVDEINAAFDDGRLTKRKGLKLSSQAKWMTKDDIIEALKDLPAMAYHIVSWHWCNVDVYHNILAQVDSESSQHSLAEWSDYLKIPISTLEVFPVSEEEKAEFSDEQKAELVRIERSEKNSNRVLLCFKIVGPLLYLLSAAGYLLAIAGMLRKKEKQFDFWLVFTGIGLSQLLNMFITILFSQFLAVDMLNFHYYYYSPGSFLVLDLLMILGTLNTIHFARERYLERKAK